MGVPELTAAMLSVFIPVLRQRTACARAPGIFTSDD